LILPQLPDASYLDFISCSRSTICSTYGFSSFDTLLILNPQDLKSDFSDNRVEGAPSSPLRRDTGPSVSLKTLLNASLGQKAAINVEERTSDVRSFRARKEHHARSDFLGATISPERHCVMGLIGGGEME
jgi:hypothetical protein